MTYGNCGATLNSFVGTTSGTGGSANVNGDGASFGVNCKDKAIELTAFVGYGLAGNDIQTTNLCKSGTTGACASFSPGFIAEISWTPGSSSFQNPTVSNIRMADGTNLSAQEIDCAGGGTAPASPLIIEDQRGFGITTLDPNAYNVLFDIKGDGIKRRISCVKDGSFLALPNARGEVKNINQLFGDNTVGPDNKKAANGFKALAKYDLNFDGVIDANDAVYNRLMLWKDDNCNGVAEARELYEIERAGITAIFTNYRNMYQVDLYGNLTLQRSIVRFGDRDIRRIFDVWFKF